MCDCSFEGFFRFVWALCGFKGQNLALVKPYFLDAPIFWHRVEGVRKRRTLNVNRSQKQPAYVAVILGPEDK